ncbi:TonB-dependent receptor plug domain-containing protein [Rhizomicrobium electricum]|jgi:iron complex outermembrane receptor protein|uniref:TonB-dependent receptor n=1 Tax=Rhizomicrobium electricum TaxID=480070 RepID=A0ABP3PNV7_9PROT|nr:TonB-dependent receptor [Rhizomicrobium electricum]NIJ48306.1 iron complex outermembrane receptor protein [Rhizomicrobium electricum]
MSKIPTLPFTALLFLSAAQAQSMDYGAIEQLFGEPATTSATGSPQRATEVPANLTIVTRDDIRRSGARDVPGILRHVAGVDVLEWANDNYDVSARGYNQAYSARTLVLVDGRQVYVDSFGFTPWSVLPVELGAIRQIEVVKGPNAALFGFNAVAGVINIITDNPRYDDHNTATVRVGSQSLVDVSGAARFGLGQDTFLRFSGGYRSDKPFGTANPLPIDGAPRPKNDRLAFDADAVVRLAEDVELDIEASHSQASQSEVSGGYKLQSSDYATNSILGRLTADTGWGLVKLTSYGNWFAWTRAVGPGFVAPRLMNAMHVVQAEDVFSPAPDHTIRLAVEYRHNEVGPRDNHDGWVAFDAGSASAMWAWQITPELSLTSALRFDSVSYNSKLAAPALAGGQPPLNGPPMQIDQWSFNTGLVWSASSTDTLRLIASRGVQLPNLVQVWDAAFGQGPGMQPLKLRPSSVTNFEALWNRRFVTFDARLQLAVFHQMTDDVLSTGSGTIDVSGKPGMAPVNVGSSQATGIEAGFDGRLAGDWTWSVSYRYEIINDNYVRGLVRTDLINYEDTTPRHVVKAGLGWASGPWEANAFLHFQSDSAGLRRFGPYRVLVPVQPFTTIDARLAYRLTDQLTLAISGRDLFNAQQQQTSGPDVQRQFFASLAFDM